jgi:rhodanese-related sulfurtransferase
VGLRWPQDTSEDRPIRSLAIALTLTLALPAVALAQDAEEDAWPSADELRAELQSIGYEFAFDGSGRAQMPEFRPELPALWTLTEPALAGDELSDGTVLEPFTLQLIDDGSGAVQLLFSATSADNGEGEYETIATTLMEIESRLPEGNGLAELVWFLGHQWQAAGGQSVAPCVFGESEDGVTLAWFGGDGEGVTSVFGTVGTSPLLPDELEACKQALAQPQDAAADTGTSVSTDETTTEPAVDYSVPPDEAVEIIEAGTHTIIDVRTPEEYEQAHVVGAINIDVESPDFAEQIAELDPDESYLVYCRSGRRSALAAQQMAEAGFTDITDGAGLADLARAGAPVE